MSLDRVVIPDNVLDRLDALESRLNDLTADSITPQTAANAADDAASVLSGWVIDGGVLRDAASLIVLDPSIPGIQIAAGGRIYSSDFVAGTSGFNINGGTAEFNDVVIRGTIYASLGEIGGWTIGATSLTGGDATLDSSGYLLLGTGDDIVQIDASDLVFRVWVGNANPNMAPFSVDKAGALIATNATISGSITATTGIIGGWTVGLATLTGGDATLASAGYLLLGTGDDIARMDASDVLYRLWIGDATAADAPFSVTKAGALLATSANITGAIDANSGHIGSLDVDGVLTVGTVAPYIQIDGPNKRIRTSTYAQGLQGFTIEGTDGSAEFNNVEVRGAIKASVLQYGYVMATNGSIWITPAAAGRLLADCTSVDSPATFNVDVEDPDGMAHVSAGALWAVGDIIRLKETLTGDLWASVSAKSDKTTYWRLAVVKQSPGAGTNYTLRAGLAILNYGASGKGLIQITADATNAPYLQMATHAGSPWSTLTARLRIGNLNGAADYVAETYGMVAGQYGAASRTCLTVDDTNGIRIFNNTTKVAQWDASGNILIGQAAANQNNVYISAGVISLRNNVTERVGITAAGILTIKDSGGNAVFSFDAAAGAEFTKPLTIGASGGIYQGTGTFAAPTTGLKMWNDTGVGRIGGYNASVLQWYASTDGKLYAGGGNFLVDANGITIKTGAVYAQNSSLVFTKTTGVLTSYLYSFYSAGLHQIGVHCESIAAEDSYAVMDAICPAGKIARAIVQAQDNVDVYGVGAHTSYLGGYSTHDFRIAGGLYVGSLATDPAAGDVIATADGRFGGGLYVGSTATDPAADTLTVDGTIAVAKAFSNHGGYGNVVDLQGGICLNRTNDAGVLYLMASFDSGGTLMSRIYNDTSGANNTLIIRQDAAGGTITLMGSNVGVGAVPAATFDVTGTVAFRAVSPAQITGNTNNWSPGTGSFIRMTSNNAYNVTGLVAGADGEIKVIVNIGSFTMTFLDQSGSSTAANRFILGGINRAVAMCIVLQYDSTSARWRLVSYL